MQQQLVLQFRRTAIAAEETLVALEQALGAALGDLVELDGHDIGAKDINVFLLSADPASAFRRSKPVLEAMQLLDRVTAAHRVVGGAQFTVIWPLRVRRRFTLD